MTVIHVASSKSSPKIKPWRDVVKEIKEAIENQNERLSITIPYGLQLENNLWNPESLRVAVHVTSSPAGDCFLSHHGVGKNNKLNVWTITTGKDPSLTKTDLKAFSTPFKFQHFLFITKRWIYISYSADLMIHVFSSKFVHISSAFTGRTLLSLEYNSKRDEILTGVAGGIMIWNFPVKQTDQLIPGRIIECSFSPEEWTVSLKMDSVWNQILALSKEKIAVLEMKNYKLQFYFSRSTEVFLTSCVLYNPLNYFIIGDQSGLIRVMSSSLASLPQVTQFLGHCDAVTSLVTHRREPLLISGSRDKTLRIWNFDTFTQTYCLQTGEEILHVDLINSSKLYYRSEHSIKVWHTNLFHTLFTTLSSKIVTFTRTESPEYPARILVHTIDGGIRLISPVTGCQLTAMMPITTLSSSIVDVCHDRRKELIYIVLENREVLVFESDSNPCCASQLWKAEYTDEGVCSIALLNAEYALGEEDLELESGLLFAGHYNGQISLLDGHGVEMKNNVQAHQGQIVRLCASHGHNVPNSTLESRDHLVSLGKDSAIRVWMIRHVKQMTIGIELKCEVRLISTPSDIAMIGNTLCMVMSDFKVVIARVKVKSKGVFTKDKPCELFFHSKDEGHTAAINGLSSCPYLKLFATSSDDHSVKLWNTKNQLVRELNFDDSLYGVCFANHCGDLLVGFQCHISLVTLTNYLPGPYLEKLSTMHFENDPSERHVQFDDHLQFWYDPKLVPTLPMELYQRRPLLPPEETPQPWEEEYESSSEESLVPVVEEDGLNWLRTASQRLSMTSRASIASRMSVLSRGDQEDGRLSSAIGSKASSLLDAQGKDIRDIESVISLLRACQQSDDVSVTFQDLVRSRAAEKALFLPPNYWLCAPDCYIPNSVIRRHIKIRGLPDHMIPKLIRPVKEKKVKKKERKKSADTMEFTKKALRKKVPSGKKIRPLPKTGRKPEGMPDQGLKQPEFMPRSGFASPAAARAEMRRKRRTSYASQPDAIFEEMSEGEEEEEQTVPPATEEKIESPVIKEEEIDYGERDEDYRYSSSSSEEEELEEEEEEVEVKEEKVVKTPVEKEEDLELKPVPRYPFATKPTTESILQQVVRKAWYPKKRKAKLEVGEVIDNITKVLLKGNLDDFEDVCTDIARINRVYGISESKTSILHDILLKHTWHEDSKVRKKAIETLRHLKVKKKDTTLAMISRIVDDDEDVREQAKDALRDLHDIYTIEDLTGTLMKLGVVSFQLPCNDNVVLSELMDRLRRIKEVKKQQEIKKKKAKEAKEEKKKGKYRLPATKRRESQFAVRRRSIKPLATETSSSDIEEFRQELNETTLGCRLLQRLSPVSNILYTQFLGSLPSLSSKSSREEIDLAVAGRSIRRTPISERMTLSSRDDLTESLRHAAMASPSPSLLPRLEASSSTPVIATAVRRHTRTLESMLSGSEALRRHSLLRRSIDVTSGVSEPLSPTIKGKPKDKKRKPKDVEEEVEESEEAESDDEREENRMKISLDEFVEVLNEMKTNHVGRTLLFSLMHIKGEQKSKKRISFYIPDIFNLISQIPHMMKQEKPVFDTVVNLLQGKGGEEFIEKSKVKMNESLYAQLLQIRTHLKDKDEQIAHVDKLMEQFRENLQSEWTAEDTGQKCAVNVMDLAWLLSLMSNKEDRKFWVKKMIIDVLKELEHVKMTPKRPSGKLDKAYTAVGKPKKRRYDDELPSSTARFQGIDMTVRETRRYKKMYKSKAAGTAVHHPASVLRTPVRRNLVPGVKGERLAHSLDINRPLPYKEIERLITEQIVKSLPHRLSFDTGACEWGLSKYGILEVTWTSRGPRYTISDVDINGRAFKKDITKYVSRDSLRQPSSDVGKAEGYSDKEQARVCDLQAENKKMNNLPPVLRNRLQKIPTPIPMPGLADLGQERAEQNEDARGGGSTFCISDTYPTAPDNSPRLLSPSLTLPSLSTGNDPSSLSRGSVTSDAMTSQYSEIFMPSMSLVKEVRERKK